VFPVAEGGRQGRDLGRARFRLHKLEGRGEEAMRELEIIAGLKEAVINGEVEEAGKLAQKALDVKLDPAKAIEKGLLEGIKVVGDAFGKGETFLPDLVLAAEALKAGSAILQEEIEKQGAKIKYAGKLLIGTVRGDIHDIGKSLVSTMFRAAGFDVVDLGTDVPTDRFVEEVGTSSPDILGLSALLSAGAVEQQKVIEALKAADLRDRVKVMVGGGAISADWAEQIGADGYAVDAAEAVLVGRQILGMA
jgi:trimethylamine corrinoid protein